jgi:hypothetical protein
MICMQADGTPSWNGTRLLINDLIDIIKLACQGGFLAGRTWVLTKVENFHCNIRCKTTLVSNNS